jgi:hypothetical protein
MSKREDLTQSRNGPKSQRFQKLGRVSLWRPFSSDASALLKAAMAFLRAFGLYSRRWIAIMAPDGKAKDPGGR